MDTFVHADIFFFITSVAVVFVSIFLILSFYYLVVVLKKFHILLEKLEENVGTAGEDIKEMVEQVKESFLFNFLFPKNRKKKKDKK